MIWYLLGILIGVMVVVLTSLAIRTGLMIRKSLKESRIPVKTFPAQSIRRRTEKEKTPDGQNQTVCMTTFRSSDGTVCELKVSQDFYSAFREGTYGELTCQGTAFLAFLPQQMPEAAQEEPEARQMPADPVCTADDFDPALFARRYPEQERSEQTPMC